MSNQIPHDEILSKLKQDKVEFVNMQFSDMHGMAKSITIPVSKFADVLKDGLWFDGSSIEGFTRIFESDMLLQPDLSTYQLIPWQQTPDSNNVRFICDVHLPDGEPYTCDPRYILKKALKEAADADYLFNTGPELEFFLFKKHNEKIIFNSAGIPEPHDYGAYFDVVPDLGYDVRSQMMRTLMKMGVDIEAGHHEVAAGQHEIDFRYDDALITADRVMTLKTAFKNVAESNGLFISFMPKPISGINGSGMHVHQSLFSIKSGDNLFFDDNNDYKLSKLAYSYLAGQMQHVRAMAAILNPLVNSYKRLVPGYEASTYICWAKTNRSALIRIPRYSKGKIKATRMEIRNPDPSANPYLVFAILLKAGLYGIKHNLVPPAPVEEDVFEFDHHELKERGIGTLPGSLADAVKEFNESALIRETLGDEFVDKYVRAKMNEWDDFRISVTDWELKRYLNII
ncbi:MAG: type I glutamate--ammonia ligase [Candidatus Kapabacteria bacterium]|nr:type I glutamate--ammonia ligase [Candidatus Kapabacteria bacterium]